jgi:hypothetical protein
MNIPKKSFMPDASCPLDGVRVVDLSRLVSGNMVSLQLADFGHARRVLAAYDEVLAKGVGAVTVDGRMIDVPIVDRARRLIEREAVIAAREAKMRAIATSASSSAI